MKTPEEMNALKEEMANLKAKLSELTEEDLSQVSGGWGIVPCVVHTKGFCKGRDSCPFNSLERLFLDCPYK